MREEGAMQSKDAKNSCTAAAAAAKYTITEYSTIVTFASFEGDYFFPTISFPFSK